MTTPAHPPRSARCVFGYTLVEMVVVIVLLGIIGSIVAVFLVRPVEGYRDLARRAALVEAAESALRRMQRDLRTALPNSVRRTTTAGGFALELIPVLDGARYHTTGGVGTTRLTFNGDDEFDVESCFRNPDTLTTSGIRMVVDNLGTGTGNDNVYTASGPDSVITPATGLTITITTVNSPPNCTAGDWHHVFFSQNHNFRGRSPNQRIYVVTTPLSYLCDTAAGTLTRYDNYAITATQPTTAADFLALNASSALVVDRVAACSVTTTTSDVRDRSLVTLTLTVAEDGEQVRLVHQVQLDNSP